MAVDVNRVQAVFLKAVEAADPAGRAAILERECGQDAALRLRVEALLQAHDDPASFMESREATGAQAADPSARRDRVEGPGDVIGPYKLLQNLGEGGMGIVWVAEQSDPVRRHVAVKVIKPGMDSAHIIARFEQERQALAMMDHPNIAKVFDAGRAASCHIHVR